MLRSFLLVTDSFSSSWTVAALEPFVPQMCHLPEIEAIR
jgi:hypothetical protein